MKEKHPAVAEELSEPPRVSVVIAARNEGPLLEKTVQSCVETVRDLEYEIIVADDASTDGSVEELQRLRPDVRVVSYRRRRGCSATKDLGARNARGNVLLFLDGHCKPEKWAIVRLVNDVEDFDGQAIITPRVPALSGETWQNSDTLLGFGYRMRLDDFSCSWLPRRRLKRRGAYYETPALVGCCLALSRQLYRKLGGFDRHMLQWGVEDVDLSLKSWLLGYPVLNNPYAVIGHRFRGKLDGSSVAPESILVNELRCARKNFSGPVWKEWLRMFRARHSRKVFQSAWSLYLKGQSSLERERDYLLKHRVHDEYWYARRFRLTWPRKDKAARLGPASTPRKAK